MARIVHIGWLGLTVFCLTTSARAGQDAAPATARLWSFAELEEQLGSAKLRILDARSEAGYAEGHIPGAVRVDVAAAEKLAASPGGLTDAKAWAEWIAPLGIGPETEVVIYDDQRQLAAARVWWLLTYLGVERAGLVDGGYRLWAMAGDHPTTAKVATPTPVAFSISFRDQRHATRAEVLKSLETESAQVLDARSLAEHMGEVKRSKRSGHIPAACNLEWSQLVGEGGQFVPLDEARERLQGARLEAGKPVIAHCQSGGRASVAAFVLERLGFPTRNYYLGWSDWGQADDTPIAGETKPD